MNIESWLNMALLKLKHSGCQSPRLDSEVLANFVLKKNVSWLIGNNFYKIMSCDLKRLNSILKRRLNGEPVAYLVHKKEFWSLPFFVSKSTLIPRADTEILVEQALERLDDFLCKDILDLGTGCGCIALALASIKPYCKIIGIDRSQKSIYIAKKNAKILKLKNANFFCSNWFSSVYKKFDIIISNPPYIGLNEINYLSKELLFEPLTALISTENGLSSIRYIIENSKRYLKHAGWLLIEHSWMQKVRVQKLFKKNGFVNIMTYRDYSGNDRVTVGQKNM
ncbi:MAG: peptide chain release factor N(5)-glutamine methyltransferase [Buchnera aphidicola (Nurudea yanoniella)]